jgi:shikimate kinase / 3-dehydroquinate synthase
MIFLTGFMGAGKTSVGRRLAERLGRPFIDIDEVISSKTQSSVGEIFACSGEEAFRALERSALLDIAGRDTDAVVATGGGLPVDPVNRSIMKACGHVVHLRADFETLATRVPEDSSRPLWNEHARTLLLERTPAYEDADFTVPTDGLSVQEVVDTAAGLVRSLRPPVPVLVPSSPYPVYIGEGIFSDILKYTTRHLRPEGMFLMVDEQVLAHHGDSIQSCLTGVRNAMAVGGGVTGDLAAFASSIFMRGIPVVHVPTTLLAQVDSSIGGKTGIDLRQGKNLVGTFHQPLMVLSDVQFLSSLESSQIRDAMAEVVKYGVIMDGPLFEYLETADGHDFEKIVTLCTRDKASVVGQDDREGGLRRILNFGHTLGHAIEHAHGYNTSHGKAVSAGMYFAAWLSRELGLIQLKEVDRIFRVIRKWTYPQEELCYPRPDMIDSALATDKKSALGGIHFVLTPGVGDATVKKLTSSQILGAYGRFIRESEGCLR